MPNEVTLDDRQVKQALQKKLSKLGKLSKDAGPIFSAFVFKDVIDHFRQERGPDSKWKSWSDSYADHMRDIGKGGNKILQDTGRLRSSFRPTNYIATKHGILWFNNAKTARGFPYAYAHNEGGRKLPKREFMWLSKKALELITKATLKHLGK